MKIIKKLLLILCSIIMVFAITSCTKEQNQGTEATRFMDEFIQTFKAGDFEKASAMTEDPLFFDFEIAEDPTFTIKAQQSAIDMMKELQYSYLSESVSDDITSLEIEFTVKNVGELFTKAMRTAVMANLEASESNLTDDEIVEKVSGAFESAFVDDPQIHKETVIVQLKKTGSGYEIIPTGELLNMLMGNLLRAQQEITQALAGVTEK